MTPDDNRSETQDQSLASLRPQSLAVLRKLMVSVEVRLGKTTITIGELLDLQPGSVLALDRGTHEPVELLVGEQVIARGELVSVEGEMGVRITELVEAPGEPI